MDIAMVVEELLPGAQYFGSVTDGTKTSWDKVVWKDTRSKPSWGNLTSTWNSWGKKVVTQETTQEIQSINQQLLAIDLSSIRPMRAILRGSPMPEDETLLEEYGIKAKTLRTHLQEIDS